MLTVLSNDDVRSLLFSLTRDDVREMQINLAQALKDYSSGHQYSEDSSEVEPRGSTISKRDGQTTMFLPVRAGSSHGYKVMTVADTPKNIINENKIRQQRPLSASASSMTLRTVPTHDSVRRPVDFTPSGALLQLETAAQRSHSRPASPKPPAHPNKEVNTSSSLTLLDSTGLPYGLINAQEFTAFRTALNSLLIFYRRQKVSTITVFGAGRQAYWHIRLALLLRYNDIKRVNIINRSFERATDLLRTIYAADHAEWRQHVKFSAFSRDFVEYDRLLRESVVKADVIFCCTRSLEPLFPAKILTSSDGRRKGRYISAIGSNLPTAAELDPELLANIARPNVHHKNLPHGSVIVVDSLETSLQHSGEIVMAGLEPRQLVEVGELLMVKDAIEKEANKPDKGLVEWIQKGNVVYKCMGLGLMDLVVGQDFIRLAREKKIGATANF
ncbi:hypothetical protein LOZ53_000636 [Ophidiomyces ophidiicola]|uniref:Uncharacterized protein n=1 Tax=Ophidiomyces ophidiicola TaxID=1387563 RepID=A0ACB8V4F2_9EURO|nr:uncharacterized protein LOZ57_005112 [Ophidiomyces ophidiicola]KAI1915026.1 hypothetical protein LOZ61_001950 [Ophidiomyces ophidiicola]KAI1923293.1 hypothetical protein LOZ64_000968 [Ophidiomyces ophidiicola]KAI1930132.1 hypothetical protein LOZ60_001191 [Ophidiomyces ophidiicola]KAI1943165.1 hypothetical protein LOZ57_005112 [Ophidiomyces ophidiicola]KAI1955024.1 hypothetical protein LOZ62_000531 [Ophidiomyces ophidiicola]